MTIPYYMEIMGVDRPWHETEIPLVERTRYMMGLEISYGFLLGYGIEKQGRVVAMLGT